MVLQLTVEDNCKKIINPLKNKIISIESKSDTIVNTKRILTDAKVIVQDKSKLIIVEASRIELQDNELSIKSKAGRVQIYDKQKEFISLRTDVNFNTLFVSKLNENVGLVVVLKEITTANKI
jgi:hypothetical protein